MIHVLCTKYGYTVVEKIERVFKICDHLVHHDKLRLNGDLPSLLKLFSSRSCKLQVLSPPDEGTQSINNTDSLSQIANCIHFHRVCVPGNVAAARLEVAVSVSALPNTSQCIRSTYGYRTKIVTNSSLVVLV